MSHLLWQKPRLRAPTSWWVGLGQSLWAPKFLVVLLHWGGLLQAPVGAGGTASSLAHSTFGLTQKPSDLENEEGIPSPRDLFSWQQFWLEIYLLAQKEKNRVILSKLYNQTGQPSLNEGLMLELAPCPISRNKWTYYCIRTITCMPGGSVLQWNQHALLVSHHCHFPDKWSWESYVNSPCFKFLIYEIELVKPASWGLGRWLNETSHGKWAAKCLTHSRPSLLLVSQHMSLPCSFPFPAGSHKGKENGKK